MDNMFPRLMHRHIYPAALVILVVFTLYYIARPDSSSSPYVGRSSPSHSRSKTSPQVWRHRANKVKQAFQHAYHGYEKYAASFDELMPLTNQGVNNFNGWGVTIYDALDTMILMNLQDEFARALPLIQKESFLSVKFSETQGRPEGYAPFFETAIRYLGGLLSAYALSHEPVLLQRADDLAQVLSPIFSTVSGFPLFGIDTSSGETIGPEVGVLAEIASFQLEYTFLAKLTGKTEHFSKVDHILKALVQADVSERGGMFPKKWNTTSGRPVDDSLSVGGAADSAHEYLLKQYLLTARTDRESLRMYLRTVNHILTNLLYLSPNRQLLYVTDTVTSKFVPSHKFEHLSCFLPGLLALGAHTLNFSLADLDPYTLGWEGFRSYKLLENYDLRELHMMAAEGLATTCWVLYADQPSGLGPDEVYITRNLAEESHKLMDAFHGKANILDTGGRGLWMSAMEKWRLRGRRGAAPGLDDKVPMPYTEEELTQAHRNPKRDYVMMKTEYLLRPETIESLYVLWRTTGDPIWRERGWTIFEAIERETKTDSGYASLKYVNRYPAVKKDEMPSYFLAETLKYLYLLFNEEDPLPLDKWVFNTEAHPFPIFSWTDWEKKKFGIPNP